MSLRSKSSLPRSFEDSAAKWLWPVALALWLAMPGTAHGGAGHGAGCKEELRQGTELYASGQLTAAITAINNCLEGEQRPSKRVRVRSHELVAKIYLARDENASAAAEMRKLLLLEPGFEPDLDASLRFQSFVARTRSESAGERVSSVSKITEDPWQAPATSEVITAEEIARRGYLDLEAVLHDLPGIDISRGNGTAYSNIYQRGYRAPTTERTLFLVDGVEHNDLTSNVAFLSRQYPLTNIERIEVVYGPASTLYGANAFVGVINVITKDPMAFLGLDEEGKRRTHAVHAVVGGGSWNTRFIDVTAAGGTLDGGLRFTVTGRLYQSDEPDLSDFDDGYWDYDPRVFSEFDYVQLGYSPAEAAKARELDLAVYRNEYNGAPVEFSDRTDNSYIGGRLEIAGLEMGFHYWQRSEGTTPWYTDTLRPGSRNGSVWVPEQTAFFLRYSRALSDNLSAFLFSRFKVHGTTPESSSFSLYSYQNERLGAQDLEAGTAAYWQQTTLVLSSNQLRNELGLVYEPSSRFNVVAGLELRNGAIQGDYVRSEGGGEVPRPSTDTGELFDVRDFGVYAQATAKLLPEENLKVVAGGRFDQNDIRPTGGYGEAFNPRLAIVYSLRKLIFKAIYSEAFKDASNFNRFATSSSRRVNNPDLAAEKVVNTELAASWHGEEIDLSLSLYEASYSDVVGLRSVPLPGDPTQTTGQFQNLGRIEIRGLQASAKWRLGDRFDLYANYTYTDPRSIEPLDGDGNPRRDVDELRIGDIADHQLNLGFHARLWRQLDLNIRVNHVGDRPTGAETTVASNPFDRIPAYTVGHGTLTYKDLAKGLDLQLLVQNFTDESYVHPGVREADIGRFAPVAPQPGRSVFLRLMLRR